MSSALFDVVIVGGGMVGSSLALALSSLPLKVAVIEPHPQNSETAPGFDARAIAFSWGSTRIFNSLGIWQNLKPIATPIKKIHVSDKGYPGITQLKAKAMKVAALGQVVELEDVGKIIHKALKETKTSLYCPARVIDLSQENENYSSLTLVTEENQEIKINGRLVVAADGKQSVIRELSGIGIIEKPYNQSAVISTLQTQLPHNNVAYERFTENGPVAFLPLSNNRISLVWMMDTTVATELVTATDDVFIEKLQAQFGQRLGKITTVGKRSIYPLNLVKAERCTDKRLVVIGNAAQSLHPIAGQGFNLGLRDVANLADCLRKSCIEGIDPGCADLLKDYEQLRNPDRQQIINFTDAMARLFANPAQILSVPRNLMLIAMNYIPQMRSLLAESAMGLYGKQPRLVRGLSLHLPEQ